MGNKQKYCYSLWVETRQENESWEDCESDPIDVFMDLKQARIASKMINRDSTQRPSIVKELLSE